MPAENIEPISPQELQVFIARLEQAAATLRFTQEAFKGKKENWVFRKRSLELGLDRIEAAIPEFTKSGNATLAGQPYGPDTIKGREARRQAQIQRAAAKKASPKKAAPKKKRG